jgi:hypothetical protein
VAFLLFAFFLWTAIYVSDKRIIASLGLLLIVGGVILKVGATRRGKQIAMEMRIRRNGPVS